MTKYVVAAVKPWNLDAFSRYAKHMPGDWHLIERPEDLTEDNLARLSPRYIFFPHWSWVVKSEILNKFECVCFHASDVPYGRGGSPVQNLIIRGHTSTRISALRMTEELDAGPVYLKMPLDLRGSGQEIYERIAQKVWKMIAKIVKSNIEPEIQTGDIVKFKRRKPDESQIPSVGDLKSIFDQIRMLDAITYPLAFIDYGNYRLEFSQASFDDDFVSARVRISMASKKGRRHAEE